MRRRTLATLILSAWVGALGWLAERHYLGAGVGEGPSRWPVPPGAAFHAIRFGDRQYGLASLTVDTLPEGLRVTELVTLDLPQLKAGTPRRTTYRVEALYTRGLQLLSWQSDLLTEHGRTSATGLTSGDTLLTVVSLPQGEAGETLAVRLRRPVILPSAIPMVAASRGLPRPGSKLNLEVYDPLDHELRTERLVVAAESVFTIPDSAEYSQTFRRWRVVHSDTVRAWRLDATVHGLPVSRWTDGSGMTVRTDYALGARLERSAFEIVNTNFRALQPARWDTSPGAPRYVLTDGRPATHRQLVLLAQLAPGTSVPAEVPSLRGGWQDRSGDTLWLGRLASGDSLPDPAGAVEPWLSRDSAVAQTAARILQGGHRPESMPRRLTEWVRRTITLEEGPSRRSAGRILATRRGTRQERVTLLVALARAAGLEARPVWGLVAIGDRWELRPWAEIRAGAWLPADPDVAGTGALAARVRLATGGEARFLDLALEAGRLRFEVLGETK
jgi:transglutaminase-like putative cysteine protease